MSETQERPRPAVGKNIVVALITQLLSWALTFAVTVFQTRYLGDAGLGKLAFVGSISMICLVGVALGTTTVLTRDVIRDGSRAGDLLRASLLIRLPLSLVAVIVAVLLVQFWSPTPEIRLLVIVMTSLGVLDNLNSLFGAALAGREKLPLLYIANLADRFLVTGTTLALVFFKAPIWMFAGVTAITVLSLLLRAYLLKDDLRAARLTAGRDVWRKSIAEARQMISEGLPFLGWSICQMLYGYSDPLVLQAMVTQGQVGWYAFAFRLIGSALFIPTALMGSVQPTLMRHFHSDKPAFLQLSKRVTTVLILAAVPLAIILLLLPAYILMAMHQKPAFAGCIPVIRWGGLGTLLYYLACAIGSIVTAADQQKKIMKASIVACVLGPLLCIICTYAGEHFRRNGAEGAMASDVLLETFLIQRYLVALGVPEMQQQVIRTLWRCALAALPLGLLLAVGTNLFPVAQGQQTLLPIAGLIVAGTAVYAIVCYFLRVLDQGLIDMVVSKLPLRRRAPVLEVN